MNMTKMIISVCSHVTVVIVRIRTSKLMSPFTELLIPLSAGVFMRIDSKTERAVRCQRHA